MNQSTSFNALIKKIDEIIHSTVTSTELLASGIAQCLIMQENKSHETLLDAGVKSAIQSHIKQSLNDNPYCSGTGFASHIENKGMAQEFWLLEWWYKKDNGLKQVSLDLDQGTQERLDFRTFEWFRIPIAEGKPYIHGPYVDYICNTCLTLTVAVAVIVEGKVLGVAALDVLVSRVEEELLPLCAKEKVILTNRDSRIIFSTVPKIRIGELYKGVEQELIYQNSHITLYRHLA